MDIDDVSPPPETLVHCVTTCKGFTVLPNTAVDEEDISDDETVITRVCNGPRPNTPVTQQIVRKLTLKFLIQSNEALPSREVAGRFLTDLHAIVSMKAPAPNIVYDMNNHPLRNFSQDNASKFEKYLYIDTIETHPTHRKPNTYWMIFNLTTSMTLTTIRRHDVVNNVIVGLKGRLSLYPWSTSDRDVESIGFVIGAIPRYQMSDYFSNLLRTTIAETCMTKRIPPFKVCPLSYLSPMQRSFNFLRGLRHSGAPSGGRQSCWARLQSSTGTGTPKHHVIQRPL
jgi:hypothetical protein